CIYGAEELCTNLFESLARDKVLNNVKRFYSDLSAHTRLRHEKYGDTAYILEPDLKEGRGGLRDYHCILWTESVLTAHGNAPRLSGVLDESDRRDLSRATDSILRIRHALHEISGRKNDRLFLEYQEPVATSLGIEDSPFESSAEVLMKHYHRSALTIQSLSDVFLSCVENALGGGTKRTVRRLDSDFELSAGQISFTPGAVLRERPVLVFRLFRFMGLHNAVISLSARAAVKHAPEAIDLTRDDPQATECFRSILRMVTVKHVLTAMHELGVLERFIPEFEAIRGRFQPDAYHTYTTDLHSIITVSELRKLESEEQDLFSRVDDPDVLSISAFLHDIGKGFGRPHATIGAPVASVIARRLGMSDDRAELVEFLVHNHLLLADLAVKRDLSEERVTMECARIVKEPVRLIMLYLLSMADSSATGPRASNQWRSMLSREL
ncbi:MAG: HD domain-containing protein, partial [Desulfomonilia bacterium]|nr:HD domain-containing protein [Desulfomonilia bacterium]